MSTHYDPHSYDGLLDRLGQLEVNVAKVVESAQSLKLPEEFGTKMSQIRAILRSMSQKIKDSSG